MYHSTPFFKAFGPLLFGRAPVCELSKALSKVSECASLHQLRKLFGDSIPSTFLQRQPFGENSRNRLFSLEVTFWSFLDQVHNPGRSCREAVRKVLAFTRRHRCIPEMSVQASAYCQARTKLPMDVLDNIHRHLANQLERHVPSRELWHGRRVRIVDGTGVSMPDTAVNQAQWPQHKGQKPGCGFPSINLVGLFCLHSGALLQSAHGDHHTHETKLFRKLWNTLSAGDILMADRGFCSYGTFAGLHSGKIDSVFRLPERKIRKAIGARLPKTSNFDVVITWKRPTQKPPGMSEDDFNALPESLPVRVIRHTVSHPGFRSQSITLVTSLLDPSISQADLAELYLQRWDVELHLREIKTHLHMHVLRCKSPHMIERELRMHFIAYNLIRLLMQKAALTYRVNLQRISFKGTLDTLRQFANACAATKDKPKTLAAILKQILSTIAEDLVPHRPQRTEPRVRKRRPKNYRLLTKQRHQMGPLPHRKIGRENHPKHPLT